MTPYAPIYIFDLDGTLVDVSGCLHHLQGPRKDWDAFYEATTGAPMFPHMVRLWNTLRQSGADMRIWTARSGTVRSATMSALEVLQPSQLLMRHPDDHREDAVLKRQWLHALTPMTRDRVVCAFEDRSRVVAMWRAEGVPCMQVAPGDF